MILRDSKMLRTQPTATELHKPHHQFISRASAFSGWLRKTQLQAFDVQCGKQMWFHPSPSSFSLNSFFKDNTSWMLLYARPCSKCFTMNWPLTTTPDYIPTWQMRKWRHRKIIYLVQDPTTGKWCSSTVNSRFSSKSVFLSHWTRNWDCPQNFKLCFKP